MNRKKIVEKKPDGHYNKYFRDIETSSQDFFRAEDPNAIRCFPFLFFFFSCIPYALGMKQPTFSPALSRSSVDVALNAPPLPPSPARVNSNSRFAAVAAATNTLSISVHANVNPMNETIDFASFTSSRARWMANLSHRLRTQLPRQRG